MAESLNREGPIDLLESAVGVLRQAGLGTLVLHWAGSIPFALVALLFREQMTNPRTSDLTCALEALALTLALLWMNCWRAVFAGRVWRQLNDSSAARRTPAELFRLVAVQSIASGTKLFVLPLAALIVFPLPAVVTFYRNLAVLADRQSRDPRAIIARARQLARAQTEQGWLILPILLLLGLLVGVNVAAVIGAAPQLVRILTGYESTFSRSGLFFISNPTFWMLVLAAMWILFDPFVQTVYCLRCYQAESRETGEDVRAGVRRLRASLAIPSAAIVSATVSAIFAAIVVATLASPCRADMQPADIEKASTIAVKSAEYNWRLPLPPGPTRDTPWIVSVTDRILASTKSLRETLGRLIERFFSWLSDQLGGSQPTGGALPTRGMHWTVYLLIALVTIIAIWIGVRILQTRRARAGADADGDGTPAIRLDADDLTPDRLPEERWLELAERALSEQNLRFALRAFYLASLAWMGRAEYISIHPGKTNREYELELRRRLRAYPEARALFGSNVAAFEGAWYGLHEVALEEINDFRGRVGEMKAMLPGLRGSAS